MPLVIPLKTTTDVDLVKPVSSFLRNTFSELGAEGALQMAREFDNQRRIACIKALDKNETSLMVLMKYHDQLVKLNGKIPFTESDCRVSFTWKDPFTSNKGFMGGAGKGKITLCSGEFELMCVLWNCGALMSQVAAGQDDDDQGTKQATKYYQQAAGVFSYIREYMAGVLNKETPTSELEPANLNTLTSYMLACAQEQIYNKAVTGKMKHKILASLCQQNFVLYQEVAKHAHNLSKDLASYAKLKVEYFKAKTQFHQGMQCKDDKKFGEMISRLKKTEEVIKTFIKDTPKYKPFAAQVKKEREEAEKENNFIYHDPVPEFANVAAIKPAVVAKTHAYEKHHLFLGSEANDVFEMVVPLQVHEANSAFDGKRQERVDLEISRIRELTTVLNGVLRTMHLPEAIEETTGTGVPQSITQKAADVRVKGGIEKLENLAQGIPDSLERNRDILNEAKRMLTEEQNGDTELRSRFGPKWTRTPSEELTKPLWTDINKYENIINKAMSADNTVREKLETHRHAMLLLSGTDEALSAAVPSGSISSVLSGNPVIAELKQLCEQAEALKAERDVAESELRSATIDMNAQFLQALAADGTINYDSISEEQLHNVYGELSTQIDDSGDRQESLLANLQRVCQEFQHLKKSGAAEHERETVMQSISAAYDGFVELNSNLEEGTKFYGDLTQLLLRLQGKCGDLIFARKTEKDEFLRELTNSAVASESGQMNAPSYLSQAPQRPPPPNMGAASAPPQVPPPTYQSQTSVGAPPASPLATTPATAPYQQPPGSSYGHQPPVMQQAQQPGAGPVPAPRRTTQPQGPPSTAYQSPYPNQQPGMQQQQQQQSPYPSYGAPAATGWPQQQQQQHAAPYNPQQQQQTAPPYNQMPQWGQPPAYGQASPYPQQPPMYNQQQQQAAQPPYGQAYPTHPPHRPAAPGYPQQPQYPGYPQQPQYRPR